MRPVSLLAVAFAALLTACSTDDGKPNNGTSSGALSDAGGGDDAGSGKKKNAEGPCAKNEECESNLCFMGGNQSYCSLPCTAANGADVCKAPFTLSCNNRGACKRD